MNRRQFLSSVASLGVSAALPTKAVPISPPCYPEIIYIPFNTRPNLIYYRDISATQQKLIETFCIPNSLLASQPLDSRREPWQACDAGDVPVQE